NRFVRRLIEHHPRFLTLFGRQMQFIVQTFQNRRRPGLILYELRKSPLFEVNRANAAANYSADKHHGQTEPNLEFQRHSHRRTIRKKTAPGAETSSKIRIEGLPMEN